LSSNAAAREGEAWTVAETVARRSYGKLIAFLSARFGDVSAAEDALSEAFAAALQKWPQQGCPENPEAWLLTVARRRSIDLRRRSGWVDETSDIENLSSLPDFAETAPIPDRRLALMFACAHPSIDAAMHAPLMLQAILGLDARAIASAFLVSPDAMGKRLVRAKQKISQAGIPFRVPERDELPDRLVAVLEAVYAAFTEGWSDPLGDDGARSDLTGEALFLAELINELLPGEPEALGLLALMLHSQSRRSARRTTGGEYVPLAQQDQKRWDWAMISRAESLLLSASHAGRPGRYQIEAAIQSAHVERCCTGKQNWDAILRLYDALLALTASPVVAVNRALAVSELQGARAGLDAMPHPANDERLAQYQPYWAARAELLQRSGETEQAGQALEIAIGLAADPAVRRYLEQRRGEVPRPRGEEL
jgi:predicted RNA polymerase sigma factor